VENQQVVQRYWDAKWNRRDPVVIAELVSPKIHYHGPAVSASSSEEYLQIYESLLSALADTSVTVEDLINEGDKIVSRVVLRGVHSGSLLGLPATGRAFVFPIVTIFRIGDGRIAEEYQMYDGLDLLNQLGLEMVPA
jgi:steroid delta-isomerase-like uncharacterized protein